MCLNTGYSSTWQSNSQMTKYFMPLTFIGIFILLFVVIQGCFKYSGIGTYSSQLRVVCNTGQWLAFSFIQLVQNIQVTVNVLSFPILWLTMPTQTSRGQYKKG